MKEDFISALNEGIAGLGIEPSTEKSEKLYEFFRLICEKNKVMNLTAITDEKEAVCKHFVDSLSLYTAGEAVRSILGDPSSRIIDVGTGAGLPGIAVRIYFEEPEIVLFDSLRKRLAFLDEVIEKLGLGRIRTLHGRAEEIGRDREHRDRYDLVMARAVAPLPVLAEYCLPLTADNGIFLAYKGSSADSELEYSRNALRLLKGRVEINKELTLPGSDIVRNIIVIRKTGPSDKRFPRRPGTPSKEPL